MSRDLKKEKKKGDHEEMDHTVLYLRFPISLIYLSLMTLLRFVGSLPK